MRKIIIIHCLLAGGLLLHGQTADFEQFIQSSYQLDISSRLSADLRTEARIRWLNNQEEGTNLTQLYIQAGGAYRLTNDLSAGISYRAALRSLDTGSPQWEHRFSQQASITQSIRKIRLRERLTLEQRILESRNYQARHRWRLRVAADYPLSGEKLDVGEAYLNHHTELLLYPFEEQYWASREHRVYSGIGWQLKKKNKLEAGMEVRLSRNDLPQNYDQRWIVRITYSFK
jgi:hypothetical protein